MNRREFNRRVAGSVAALGLRGRTAPQAALRVDGARINTQLAALAEVGKNPQGGVSRVAYTEADAQGRELVKGWMREANLEVSVDLAGNLLGRRPGRDAALKPLVLGSHIDSVPEGGNYDGDVGSRVSRCAIRSRC